MTLRFVRRRNTAVAPSLQSFLADASGVGDTASLSGIFTKDEKALEMSKVFLFNIAWVFPSSFTKRLVL